MYAWQIWVNGGLIAELTGSRDLADEVYEVIQRRCSQGRCSLAGIDPFVEVRVDEAPRPEYREDEDMAQWAAGWDGYDHSDVD